MTTNKDRANYAAAAIEAFKQLSGSTTKEAIGDLMVDLLHLARREQYTFNPHVMVNVALANFLEEEMQEAMSSEDIP